MNEYYNLREKRVLDKWTEAQKPPLIPVLPHELIEQLRDKIKPLKRIEDEGAFFEVLDDSDVRITDDPRVDSLQESPKPIGLKKDLEETLTMITFHDAWSPRSYSYGEILSQIPEDLRDSTVGYEVKFVDRIDGEDFPMWMAVFRGPLFDTVWYKERDYFVANTTLYRESI